MADHGDLVRRAVGRRTRLDLDGEDAAFVDDLPCDPRRLRASSSSTRCRSSGSSLSNSIRRPSVGMRERQPRRMQERPFQMRDRPQIARHTAVHAAVQRVADDRMTDGAQVHANLMRPAGVNRDARQRQHPPEMLGAYDPA